MALPSLYHGFTFTLLHSTVALPSLYITLPSLSLILLHSTMHGFTLITLLDSTSLYHGFTFTLRDSTMALPLLYIVLCVSPHE